MRLTLWQDGSRCPLSLVRHQLFAHQRAMMGAIVSDESVARESLATMNLSGCGLAAIEEALLTAAYKGFSSFLP